MKIATLETGVLDIAKKIRDGIEAAGGDAVKLASFVENNSTEITALASLGGAGSAAVTGTSLGILNLVITAVKGASTAAKANGLSVSFDSAAIAEVEKVIDALEKL
jgi:hypothetical protein